MIVALRLALLAGLAAFTFRPAIASDVVRSGYLKTAPAAPIFVAKEKGYYAAEGLDVELITFDAAEPVAVAVAGGQVDGALAPVTFFTPLLDKGGAKVLGYIGDETPWQLGVILTSTRMANEHPDIGQRWLRAFRNAALDYHDAFTGPDGKRADQPTAPALLAIMSKYIGQTPEQIDKAVGFVPRRGGLDVNDIHRQVAWFKSQGLLKE